MVDNNGNDLFKGMKYMIGGGIIISIALLIIFLINQTYSTDLPVDTGVFGTYGDFIGGVLGTIVALYSAYLLIRTFQNQSTVNESVKKTNDSIISANTKADAAAQRQYYQTELQIFDGKFSRFFDAYQSAVASYEIDEQKGRPAFEIIAESFINREFSNNNKYKPRCASATDEYLEFYAEHQTVMSVHLRMLYLLISLISESNLEENDKVQYAKLVRGQMSNAEMLIVRYNCHSHYGKKMQQLCNKYNLTKHISISRLLEFKAYRKAIDEKTDESSKLLSGLDVLFITLRKRATKMLYDGNPTTDEYKTSHSYVIKLAVSGSDGLAFTFEVQKNRGLDRRGGGIRVSPVEYALDCLTDDQLEDLFKDYLCELFIFSNFELYNKGTEIKLEDKVSDDKALQLKWCVSNTKRLVLSNIQKSNRDNPIEALE